MKNLYLTALSKHAAGLEFNSEDPLTKQALARTAVNATRRAAGNLMDRGVHFAQRNLPESAYGGVVDRFLANRTAGWASKQKRLTNAIDDSKIAYAQRGVDKGLARAGAQPSSRGGSSTKFNANDLADELLDKADAVEKWAPRAAAGATGLAALGGTAYGSSAYTRNHIANKIDQMSALERAYAALGLTFNPSAVSGRLRG